MATAIPTGGPPVADAVTGTNTEKIDALVAQVADLRVAVAEMRTTFRLLGGLVVLLLPILAALTISLSQQVSSLTAEVRTLQSQVRSLADSQPQIDRQIREMNERLIRLEALKKP